MKGKDYLYLGFGLAITGALAFVIVEVILFIKKKKMLNEYK